MSVGTDSLTSSLQLFQPPEGELLAKRRAANCVPREVHHLELRSKGRKRLFLVVAGYKEDLWPLTMLRLKVSIPQDTDVCVVSPGRQSPALQSACSAMDWSYLATKENRLSLAQNVAIALHPEAEWIHKVDEDIVVSAAYCESLEETYRHAAARDECSVGFVAPTLNVNGFSYRSFLNFLGPEKLAEFKARFGDARMSCVGTAAWRDPQAAQFLWELSMPFDSLARRFTKRPVGYDICPHRFSIGALLFHRSLWSDCGGFTVANDGQLGVEEADLCAFCCDNARLMLVSHRTFAGHVGFFPQARHMIPWISKRDINQPAVASSPAVGAELAGAAL